MLERIIGKFKSIIYLSLHLNNGSLEAPTFSVPVEKLSLPGTHIFASSTVNSLVILSGGRGLPSKNTVIIFGWTATGVCVYFVVVQSSDRRFCLDAQVMRETSCCSDLYMVRAKLCFRLQKAVSGKTGRKRILAVRHLFSGSVRKKYQEMLTEKLDAVNDSEEYTESCWSVMKTSLLSAAEEVVGYGSVQWDCIKKLQIVYCRRKPFYSQVSAIVDENIVVMVMYVLDGDVIFLMH